VLRPPPTPHTLRVTTDIPGPHGVSEQSRSAKRVTDARRPTFITIGERLFDRGQDTPARSIDYVPWPSGSGPGAGRGMIEQDFGFHVI
jgi:hypothetical protein